MGVIFIYVTCPSLQIAQSISQGLLEMRLIGCVNIFPVTAKYRWEGKIVEENEVVMILKTMKSATDSVESEIKKLHPYQVSCIAKIAVDINESFGKWIEGEIK